MKKVFVLICSVALLAACGGDDKKEDSKDGGKKGEKKEEKKSDNITSFEGAAEAFCNCTAENGSMEGCMNEMKGIKQFGDAVKAEIDELTANGDDKAAAIQKRYEEASRTVTDCMN